MHSTGHESMESWISSFLNARAGSEYSESSNISVIITSIVLTILPHFVVEEINPMSIHSLRQSLSRLKLREKLQHLLAAGRLQFRQRSVSYRLSEPAGKHLSRRRLVDDADRHLLPPFHGLLQGGFPAACRFAPGTSSLGACPR